MPRTVGELGVNKNDAVSRGKVQKDACLRRDNEIQYKLITRYKKMVSMIFEV